MQVCGERGWQGVSREFHSVEEVRMTLYPHSARLLDLPKDAIIVARPCQLGQARWAFWGMLWW
jgi:hypothetical protein